LDHAINQLSDYMQATISMYQDNNLSKKEVKNELRAYVDALNSLEKYHYGKSKTDLEGVLSVFSK